MDFYAILDQVIDLLRQRQRVTYRALQRQFDLDEDALNDLKDELLYAHPQVVDDEGRGLRWTGDTASTPVQAPPSTPPASQLVTPGDSPLQIATAPLVPYGPAGAFAQEYTVMRNTLSDNKLYGHKKASQDCISDLTVLKKKDQKTRSIKRMERQKP
jgi:hypothetical protein